MRVASYMVGVGFAAVVLAALATTGVMVRRRLLPGWSGAPARLAEVVLAFLALVVACEIAGTVGLLTRAGIVIGTGLAAGIAIVVARRAPAGGPQRAPVAAPRPSWAGPAATLVVATVVVLWLAHARQAVRDGVTTIDSLHYHLPFAARFAQTGRVADLVFLWFDPSWSFYPANAELAHAVGMVVFGRDAISPLLNLLWLGVGLLSAWVAGLRFGVPHVTVGLGALVWAAPLFARLEAGSATNDAAVLALFSASIALLAHAGFGPRAAAVAGAAAGLAVGVKLTAIAPVAGLTIVIVVLAWRRRSPGSAAAWIAATVAGGGYWYLRNLVRTGSPVTMVDLPGLPAPRQPAVDAYGYSVADYAGDAHFWRSVVPGGLREVFGVGFPGVLLLAGLGLTLGIVALVRGGVPPVPRAVRAALVAAAVTGGVVYLFTPVTAYGPKGNPFLFGVNLRYVFPALIAALVLLSLAVVHRVRWHAAVMVVSGMILATGLATDVGGADSPLVQQPLWLAAAIAGWALLVIARRNVPRLRTRALVLVAVPAAVLALVVGYGVVDGYLDRRYTSDPVWAWARTTRNARVAVVAYPQQFPLTGIDLSNHVQYVGRRVGRAGFRSYATCSEFRQALRAGRYDYLVAGWEKWDLEPAPERAWVASDPSARVVLDMGDPPASGTSARGVTVFALDRSSTAQALMCG